MYQVKLYMYEISMMILWLLIGLVVFWFMKKLYNRVSQR